MNLTYEYIRHRRGYSFAAGCCWIRIYEGEAATPPWSSARSCRGRWAGVAEMAEQLAAEVILEHFTGGLPELPRPLLWVEHRPARRRGPPLRAPHLPLLSSEANGPGLRAARHSGRPAPRSTFPEEVAILTGGEAGR